MQQGYPQQVVYQQGPPVGRPAGPPVGQPVQYVQQQPATVVYQQQRIKIITSISFSTPFLAQQVQYVTQQHPSQAAYQAQQSQARRVNRGAAVGALIGARNGNALAGALIGRRLAK